MRAGFDARWYNDSGVGTYVAELLKALASPQLQRAQEQNGLELVVYEDPENPVPDLPSNHIKRIPLKAGKYSFRGQLALSWHARQDRLDVFHSPFYPIPLRIACPVVATFHDLIPFLLKGDNWLKQLAIRWGYRVAAARSSRIIAVSRHTAKDITRILRVPPQKISAIHNGVSHVDFHAQGGPQEAAELASRYGIHSPYVVVGSARNWQHKNLASALHALVAAQKYSTAEFQTVIYGPPEGLRAAGGPQAWSGLKLIQTGHLAAQELARIFRHAHAFIMPSLYEGFGLPVVEAMACGCAVITSNGGSVPEIGGNAALVFDPLDISGMASAVIRLLSDPERLNQWKQRALTRAADFSWSRTAEETISVYDQAMKDRGSEVKDFNA